MNLPMRLIGMHLIALVSVNCPAVEYQSDSTVIQPGHWLEVRGTLNDRGELAAQRIELVAPQKYQEVIGTATHSDLGDDYIALLGLHIKITKRTDFRKVSRSGLPDRRIKVEGYHQGQYRLLSRKISARNPGRDRLLSRVDDIQWLNGKGHLSMMGVKVTLPADTPVRHEQPLAQIVRDSREVLPGSLTIEDDDDLFGKGARIGDNASITMQLEGRSINEDNFNLDNDDAENRRDQQLALRTRLQLKLSPRVSSRVEVRHRQLFRDDDEDGRFSSGETRLGEAYLLVRDLIPDFDLQAGRQDFDDPREWLFDENLDGVRVYWLGEQLAAQVSLTTTFAGGDSRDRNTRTTIAYLSNRDRDRHLAGYVIDRYIDEEENERRTHLGLRAIGEWLPGTESWLELSYMTGKRGETRTGGLGLDLGLTWEINKWTNVTMGFALGEGGESDRDRDRTFRQTQLQDNNGKFAGITSFRYYGELLDPELSNLCIFTAGVGFNINRHTSIDLVWHYYQQDNPRDELIETDLDEDPNGINRNLGWEMDAIIGWRPGDRWDIEAVIGHFRPGAAFDNADSSTLMKLQVRYRY